MSLHAQHIAPACAKCRKNYHRLWLEKGRDQRYLLWLDVSFVRREGEAFVLRCNNCGHEWHTKSAAAHYLWD